MNLTLLGSDVPPNTSIELGPIEQIVLQSTPFCNLDCKYCYLPSRSDTSRMSVETAVHAITALATSRYAADRIECRWHAGEPLAVGTAFYRGVFEQLRQNTAVNDRVWHSLQTNATLLTDEWCDLFSECGVVVGVSIDGPEEFNDRNRVTRSGRGTFSDIMRGIGVLQRRNIPFTVIAVVTAESLAAPKQLYEFFAGLGAKHVGLNIEESEGGHTSHSLAHADFADRYRHFLGELLTLQRDGRVEIRELREMDRVVRFGKDKRKSLMAHPLSIVSVDWKGNVSSFSPELCGQHHVQYGNFILGNILTDSIERIASVLVQSPMCNDILRGVHRCSQECSYFFLCGGGAPANKLYENGTFISTETGYCRSRIKMVADLVIGELEQQEPLPAHAGSGE